MKLWKLLALLGIPFGVLLALVAELGGNGHDGEEEPGNEEGDQKKENEEGDEDREREDPMIIEQHVQTGDDERPIR